MAGDIRARLGSLTAAGRNYLGVRCVPLQKPGLRFSVSILEKTDACQGKLGFR